MCGSSRSVAKMTIFIATLGPGCVGSEVADEAYRSLPGKSVLEWVQDNVRCWQSWGRRGDAACPGFAHFPLIIFGCLDALPPLPA